MSSPAAAISATRERCGRNRDALRRSLEALPDSFVNRYRFAEEKDSLTLPLYAKTPLCRGLTRHEEALGSLELTQNEARILWALAAHAKGFGFSAGEKGVSLLPYGWLEITGAKQAKPVQMLAEKCRDAGLPWLEAENGRFYRLSVAPKRLFFDAEAFCYDLSFVPEEDKWRLTLCRGEIETPLGKVAAVEKGILVSRTVEKRLQQVREQGLSCIDDDGALKELAKKSIEQKLNLEQTGLRKFLRIENNQYQLACRFRGC